MLNVTSTEVAVSASTWSTTTRAGFNAGVRLFAMELWSELTKFVREAEPAIGAWKLYRELEAINPRN